MHRSSKPAPVRFPVTFEGPCFKVHQNFAFATLNVLLKKNLVVQSTLDSPDFWTLKQAQIRVGNSSFSFTTRNQKNKHLGPCYSSNGNQRVDKVWPDFAEWTEEKPGVAQPPNDRGLTPCGVFVLV